MPIGTDIAAYIASVQANVSTQVAVNTIAPPEVGAIGIDLAVLLAPYIVNINNFTVTGGASIPTGGADTDLHFQGLTNEIHIWRNVAGTWTDLATVPIGFLIGDGPITLRDFISGLNVTVTAGSWAISNTIYRKLTQTGLTANAADLNFYRYDLIYADTLGAIQYLAGMASVTPAFPTLPANTIAVDYVIVPSTASGFDPYLLYNDPSGGTSTGQLIPGTSDTNGEYDLSLAGLRSFPLATIYDAFGVTSPAQYDNTNQKIIGLNPSSNFTARFI